MLVRTLLVAHLPETPDPVEPSPATKGAEEAPPTPDPEELRRIAEKEARKAEKREKKEAEKELEREKKEKKKKKKQQKAEEEALKPLDARERYKALVDALKEAQDLIDLADHKTRFALIIMGALNAAIFIVTTRSNAMGELPPAFRPWAVLYLLIYIPVAVFFLYQAIETLRPRRVPDSAAHPGGPGPSGILGLRFFADVLRRPLPEYVQAWNEVRMSQLTNEVASQLYMVSKINRLKYAAVTRLYQGLQIVTMLTVLLVVVAGYYAGTTPDAIKNMEAGVAAPQKSKGGKAKKPANVDLLAAPQHFAIGDVREPSGVVYVPSSSSLFVIGDEGSLARVDLQGNVVTKFPVKGNLEDVTFHPPSGKLIILNEKKGELLVTDAQTGTVSSRFSLDVAALLGPAAGGKNEGFEGLTFRAVPGEPGGGIFYLVHQKEPAALLAIAFDPAGPGGIIGSAAKRGLREMPGRDDLTAVTVMPDKERLAVIAHHRILIMNFDGDEEFDFQIPGSHQEGIAFDPEGNLWIAEDRSPEPRPNPIDQPGLLLFKGALGIIEKELAGRNPDDSAGSAKS
jgi:uncharacterized protein YjiK